MPQQVLPHLVASCPAWAARFWDSWGKFKPSAATPWRLILYRDEIALGNQFKVDNARKSVAVFVSFLEFGSWLQDENARLPIGSLRSTFMRRNVAGGCSNVVRLLLRKLFLGDASLQRGIEICGRPFFAIFHRMVMDEAAGKDTWGTKGASGLRPRMACKNVCLSQDDPLSAHDANNYLVPLSLI